MKNRLTKLSLIVLTALFSVSASAQMKDGDYNAESKGVWGSPIKVNLSIKNGKIADVKFTHNETPAVGGSALDKIKADVLKSQNINVDAISGATATSKAALSALEAAFLKAGGSKAISKKTSTAKDKAYENTTTDVVVVGGGPGGMMAAIDLCKAGKKVILLEKQGVLGGNGTFVSTYYQAGGTSIQDKNKDKDVSEEDFAKYLSTYPQTNPEMAKAVAPGAREAFELLVQNGADLKRTFKPFAHAPSDGRAPGLEITPAFVKALNKVNADVRLNNRATELIQENGKIVGVKVQPKDGKLYLIRAKDVILATGGYSAGKELLKQYTPEVLNLGTTNSAGTTGDGHIMAQKVGANLTRMKDLVLNPVTYNANGTHISFTAARFNSGGVMVNQEGKRFVDTTNNDKTGVTMAMLKASKGTGIAYLIFDQEPVSRLAILQDYVAKGYVVKDDTIPGLAKKLGVDPKGLEETVIKFRKYAKEGKDPEFGRKTFKCKLDQPPYYGVAVEPSVHATLGGIAINAKSQALDKNGNVIPGLYAVGQVSNSELGRHGVNIFVPPSFAKIAVKDILSK